MPKAEQVLALIKSHLEGDEERFRTVALQVAAHEARQGHAAFAREMRDLVDDVSSRNILERKGSATLLAQPRGELGNLISASYPKTQLDWMTLAPEFRARLERILLEQRQSQKIEARGLHPRRKLLLVGPPGSGKTMTASALAGELGLPLFTILLEGVITKFMGETAAKLRLVFDAMQKTRGVFLFDEFDAIGARRTNANDVGEIRRVLNSFLQFLEKDRSQSIIVCATNHPDLLDRALFRRFDDVLEYSLPDDEAIERIFTARLTGFDLRKINWREVRVAAAGLSQADVVRAAEEAAKVAVLADSNSVSTKALLSALSERRLATQ